MIHTALIGIALAIDPSTTAREIVYHEVETPVIYTQLGYVTTVILPQNERIMSDSEHPIYCGLAAAGNEMAIGFDVRANGNILYIKPKDMPKTSDPNTGGKSTNIAFQLASGNHMEFLVREVSKDAKVRADLKVFIKEGDAPQIAAANDAPKFVPVEEKDALVRDLEAKTRLIEQLQAQQRVTADSAAVHEAQSITHGYRFSNRKGKEDFRPAIWRDKDFTYIEVHSQEKPAVFEYRDGKPVKIEALLSGDKYTIQHLVDKGELRAGKSSISFEYIKE